VGVLMSGRRVLAHVDQHEPARHSRDEADVLTAADA
jgi:MFS transporter, ACDE family, multidrug resistance protein